MPTPSNNPPPELPPRSYSASCPDDVRAPAQALHRHATPADADAMQVDNRDGAPTPPAPEPSSASASASHGPVRTAPPPPPPASEPPVATMTDEDSEEELEEDELMGLLNDLSGPDESGLDESQPESLEGDEVRGLFSGLSRRPESRSGVGTAQTSPQSAAPDDECDRGDGTAPGEPSSKALETTGAGSGGRDHYTPPASEMHTDVPDELVSLMAENTENRRMLQSFELPPMGYETTNMRIIPTLSSSFLRPGSKFKGTQQSERQIYDVEVEIKNVDLRESFLCGYLKIQGLTEDNPNLTTYFEGEIIGPQHGFFTKHESWGATDRIDLNHWNKFSAFRPYAKQAKRGSVHIQHPEAQENIFMRWKELFLVPNHRVLTINGASFEGFYYICFNQREGCISGIYFHARSEKFQQLELKHVDDRGCFAAMELR